MKTVRVGVIRLGFIGRVHVDAGRRRPGVQVAQTIADNLGNVAGARLPA